MPRNILLAALLRSPPALRSEILRRASSQDVNILQPARAYNIGAYHQPNTTARRRHTTQGRYQSTAARTAATSSDDARSEPPRRSRLFRFFATTALSAVLFGGVFLMSAAPAVETANGYLHPPTDAETLHLYAPTTEHEEEVNEHILNHPLAVSLRAQPGMVESRPHMRIPAGMRPHNLTAGVLAGEGKIEVPPLSFNDNDAELPSMIQLMHFGKDVCGHPGLVHGGMLATMLDEGLARACFPALPNKIGVTASLKIDYRVPCPAGSYVVLKAYTQKVEGRKAWVKGWIELLGEEEGTGTKVVEAEALFIEPKNAGQLVKNLVAS